MAGYKDGSLSNGWRWTCPIEVDVPVVTAVVTSGVVEGTAGVVTPVVTVTGVVTEEGKTRVWI